MKPVIIIQGPTAVGKSSLALDLAQKLKLEIISADSRQIYKYMDLGTAKPTKEELNRVKHHLIDIVTPDQSYNAGAFAEDARKLVDESNLNFPIIAGGTGFYISSFLEGLCKVPDINEDIRQAIMQEYDKLGADLMYDKLLEIDPMVAKKVELNDKQRVCRALEVYQGTGKKLSEYWAEQGLLQSRKVLNVVLVDDREDIYDRINRRYDEMVETGLLEEVRKLLEMGYKIDDPGMTAVGYKELIPHLLNGDNLKRCVDLAKQHSRNYAKRQLTWYRKCKLDLVFYRKSIKYNDIDYYIKKFINENC
jgi:tRNA dimethylallyltransferase